MVLKEDEYVINRNGASFKTNTEELQLLKININEYFLSLDFKFIERPINNGDQHTYSNEKIKFTFDYFNTGRVVIKTNQKDKLSLLFFEKHETNSVVNCSLCQLIKMLRT